MPEELCESGPYRHIRHPIYLAYQVAYLAAFVALPHWITRHPVGVSVALFTFAARSDEATIADQPARGGLRGVPPARWNVLAEVQSSSAW